MPRYFVRLIAALTALYGLWMVFLLMLHYSPTRAMFAANVLGGILAALFTVRLQDNAARYIELPSLMLYGAALLMFFGVAQHFGQWVPYRTYSETGALLIHWQILLPYLLPYALAGALLMGGLWLLRFPSAWLAQGGHSISADVRAAGLCMVGLALSPFLAAVLYGGGVIVVVAFCTRILLGLVESAVPLRVRAFGVGMSLPMLPMLAFGAALLSAAI